MRSLAFVALLALSAPALASDAPPADKPAKAKKICRPNGADTGTRLSRSKICKTAAEWEAQKARDDASVRNATGGNNR